jgi:hypothetical protein
VALNGDIELSNYYLPTVNEKEGKANPPQAVAPGKCSAFVATGSATKDGKIVIAHSNWSSYAEGERWTVVFDIVPSSGQHLLMDGLPGVITSQDDFGVNASGPDDYRDHAADGRKGFDVNGIPEFERSRKAMQYATSIDEYAAIMRKGNNGGYANSWLIGDRKTGEIGYLELGIASDSADQEEGWLLCFLELCRGPGADSRGYAGVRSERSGELDECAAHSGRGVYEGALRQAGYGAGRSLSFRS